MHRIRLAVRDSDGHDRRERRERKEMNDLNEPQGAAIWRFVTAVCRRSDAEIDDE